MRSFCNSCHMKPRNIIPICHVLNIAFVVFKVMLGLIVLVFNPVRKQTEIHFGFFACWT